MNQSERRQYLIRELIAEDKEYQRLAIPKDEGGQKVLLRALKNVRAPKPCGEEFLKIQDAYLQEADAVVIGAGSVLSALRASDEHESAL
ncbi:MAG: hypothetical protein EGQ41_08495 [Clostridiales bacterium]|nr:hypothetical protein [Clostridiales bacterium]